jgi:small subunit ribosomal protein S17
MVSAMKKRGIKRQLVGTVISDKMDSTVVVQVERLVKHRLYKKYIRRRLRLSAHDAQNDCGIGDTVRIIESRPISKSKKWRVCEILEKAV